MNILFTNAGRRTYILDYALKLKGLKIFITETDKYTPAAFYKNVKKLFTVQVNNNSKTYINQILKITIREKIKIIIPLSDHDLEIFSKNRKKFLKLGCDVIISQYSTIKKCVNKKLMYENCIKNKINTPKSFFKLKNIFKGSGYLKKEIKGSGSKNMEIYKNKINLEKINFKNFLYKKKLLEKNLGLIFFQ